MLYQQERWDLKSQEIQASVYIKSHHVVSKATIVPHWWRFEINQGRCNSATPQGMQSPSQPASTVPCLTMKWTWFREQNHHWINPTKQKFLSAELPRLAFPAAGHTAAVKEKVWKTDQKCSSSDLSRDRFTNLCGLFPQTCTKIPDLLSPTIYSFKSAQSPFYKTMKYPVFMFSTSHLFIFIHAHTSHLLKWQ